MRRFITLVAFTTVLEAMVLTTSPAGAITFGAPDGEGHPNVGVLVVRVDGTDTFGICSGTLISPTVYVTASHCTAFFDFLEATGHSIQVFVSFDSEFDPATSTLIPGTHHTNPAFGHDFGDFGDVAVVVFDAPVADKTPASLPPAGLFDQLGPHGLRGQQFTAVGYGVTEPSPGAGSLPQTFTGFGTRRVSVSSFNALNKTWLRLSQNQATGDGGTCFGDSGGPNFMGAGADETDVIAGVTVTGDAVCLATNVIYRLDTPSARAFLDDFVTLP